MDNNSKMPGTLHFCIIIHDLHFFFSEVRVNQIAEWMEKQEEVCDYLAYTL